MAKKETSDAKYNTLLCALTVQWTWESYLHLCAQSVIKLDSLLPAKGSDALLQAWPGSLFPGL